MELSTRVERDKHTLHKVDPLVYHMEKVPWSHFITLTFRVVPPEFIQKRYILNYLIYTSLLSNSYDKKNIFIINNNKVKNLKSFIKSKKFLDQNFTKIKLNNFLKNKIFKNYKNFYTWSGHPLAIDKNFKIYVLNSCKDDKRLLYNFSICPTLLIGKLMDY